MHDLRVILDETIARIKAEVFQGRSPHEPGGAEGTRPGGGPGE